MTRVTLPGKQLWTEIAREEVSSETGTLTLDGFGVASDYYALRITAILSDGTGYEALQLRPEEGGSAAVTDLHTSKYQLGATYSGDSAPGGASDPFWWFDTGSGPGMLIVDLGFTPDGQEMAGRAVYNRTTGFVTAIDFYALVSDEPSMPDPDAFYFEVVNHSNDSEARIPADSLFVLEGTPK